MKKAIRRDLSARKHETADKGKNNIFVARYSEAVIIRVDGLGSMNNSAMFTAFINAMLEKGYRKFIVNLANCTGMDSTFMGSLLGVSLRLQDLGAGWVSLINVSDNNLRLLSMLGVAHYVRIQEQEVRMASIEMERLPAEEVTEMERLRLIQKAHEHLIGIDEHNRKQFGAFLDMLTNEIERGGKNDKGSY